MENSERAQAAAEAIDSHAEYTGNDGTDTDPESALRDLLANIRHWCQRESIDFDAALTMSLDHFEAEGGRAPDRSDLDSGNDESAMDDHHAIAQENGKLPFTVVVRYNVADDPGAGSGNTYIMEVTAEDPHEAGGRAIDGLIREVQEGHPSLTGEPEEVEEWMETERVDYKCIAIYEGHHENLIR